jgi:hypothetical protein
MTQTQQPTPFNVDLSKILPTIANLYKQFSWAIPMIETMTGFKVPPQIIASLNALAEGKPLTPQDMETLKTSIETMQPAVGEPVMTKELAESAWFLHTKEHMGTREIAEQFTKDGSPCSHTTVARWINAVDAEKRFGKIARLLRIGKLLGFIGILFLAFWIGKTFF